MCVRIGKPPSVDISALRENYLSPEFLEDQVLADPIDQVFHLPKKVRILVDCKFLTFDCFKLRKSSTIRGIMNINFILIDPLLTCGTYGS